MSSASSLAACSTAFPTCRSPSAISAKDFPVCSSASTSWRPRSPKRPVTAYLRENIHYTFSGFFFPPTFLALLLELGGVDRMMFSVDHPYQSMAEGRAFLEQLPVSAADKERIAHGNAEKLFKL
jgi:predicted TIM-barrel fold metal-dependent hydrolase